MLEISPKRPRATANELWLCEGFDYASSGRLLFPVSSDASVSGTERLSEDDLIVQAAYEAVDLDVVVRSALPFPAEHSPIVVSVVKDERVMLGHFLRHYRRHGVERFAFIDNGSTDGSVEFLAAQPDVDVFKAAQSFDWRMKQAWINRAFDYYGIDRWFVVADADEHMIFDGAGVRSLPDLAQRMEAMGVTRVRGFLLDMYSEGPILLTGSDDDPLETSYPFFDSQGYSETLTMDLVSRIGGPRMRAFARNDPEFKPQLTKYPLFRLTAGEFMPNPHHIWPRAANFRSPCYIAILHYKFHGDVTGRVARAVARGNYWDGSREYKAYAQVLAASPEKSLLCELSRRMTGFDSIAECGLIERILWPPFDASSLLHSSMMTAMRERRAERLAQCEGGAGLYVYGEEGSGRS